jgi:hypothetical protein
LTHFYIVPNYGNYFEKVVAHNYYARNWIRIHNVIQLEYF